MVAPHVYASVLAAYTKLPGKHTEVAKVTGLTRQQCTALWETGDAKLKLPPIRFAIDAAIESAPLLAGATVAQEIISQHFNGAGMAEASKQAREAKEIALQCVETNLAVIRANAAKALQEEQQMIAAGRNAIHGVYALVSLTLGALKTVLEKTLTSIAQTPIESPKEGLALLEQVTGILHQAGLAAKNVQEMERSMLSASGWEAPTTEKAPGDKPKASTTASSVEDSIRIITQAADLCKGLGSMGQKLSAIDVPYQEETGS